MPLWGGGVKGPGSSLLALEMEMPECCSGGVWKGDCWRHEDSDSVSEAGVEDGKSLESPQIYKRSMTHVQKLNTESHLEWRKKNKEVEAYRKRGGKMMKYMEMKRSAAKQLEFKV